MVTRPSTRRWQARREAERRLHLELAQMPAHGLQGRDPLTLAAHLCALAQRWRDKAQALGPRHPSRSMMRAAAERCACWARAIKDAVAANLPAPSIVDLPAPSSEWRGRARGEVLPVPT